ncbi:g2708 [Coccomyxa elongata]
MTDFEGRSFEFVGEVGAHYNVISELNHQVSMKLKLGQMWDHNGTYIEGVGFRYQDHEVMVVLDSDDNMHVYLDKQRLVMSADENEQEHILGLQSDLLSVVIFKTHAGTRDEGGVLQPAYLNFDAALLGPPAHDLKGIIGEGYQRLAAGSTAATAADDFKFRGNEADYKMDSYFSTGHAHNAFGVARTAAANRAKRSLHERANVAFPLHSTARGGPFPAAAAAVVPEVGRRRLIEGVTLRQKIFA